MSASPCIGNVLEVLEVGPNGADTLWTTDEMIAMLESDLLRSGRI